MTETDDRERRLTIQKVAGAEGYDVIDWREEDGELVADLGRVRVIADDDEAGVYADDEGELTAQIVGAPEYGNERVAFCFKAPEHTDSTEVDLENVEKVA